MANELMRILNHGWQFACKVATGGKVCKEEHLRGGSPGRSMVLFELPGTYRRSELRVPTAGYLPTRT